MAPPLSLYCRRSRAADRRRRGAGGAILVTTATVEQLVAVVKVWTLARFAAAQSSRFVLPARRFEPLGTGFCRSALAEDCAEANGPCDVVARVTTPTVWSHSAIATVLELPAAAPVVARARALITGFPARSN